MIKLFNTYQYRQYIACVIALAVVLALPISATAATKKVTLETINTDIGSVAWAKVNIPGEFGLKNVKVSPKKVSVGDDVLISWDYKTKPDPSRYVVDVQVSPGKVNAPGHLNKINWPFLSPDTKSYTWDNLEVGPWQKSKDRYFTVVIKDKLDNDKIVAAVTSKKVTLTKPKVTKSKASKVTLVQPLAGANYGMIAPLPIELNLGKQSSDAMFEVYLIRPDGSEYFIDNYRVDMFSELTNEATRCYVGTCKGYGIRVEQLTGSQQPINVSFKSRFSVTAR